jgi:hypothetical protein
MSQGQQTTSRLTEIRWPFIHGESQIVECPPQILARYCHRHFWPEYLGQILAPKRPVRRHRQKHQQAAQFGIANINGRRIHTNFEAAQQRQLQYLGFRTMELTLFHARIVAAE